MRITSPGQRAMSPRAATAAPRASSGCCLIGMGSSAHGLTSACTRGLAFRRQKLTFVDSRDEANSAVPTNLIGKVEGSSKISSSRWCATGVSLRNRFFPSQSLTTCPPSGRRRSTCRTVTATSSMRGALDSCVDLSKPDQQELCPECQGDEAAWRMQCPASRRRSMQQHPCHPSNRSRGRDPHINHMLNLARRMQVSLGNTS